jgi:hypothetical protein
MARTQTLDVPQEVAGTNLRPVVALLPVAAVDEHGGAEASDSGGGKGALALKGAAASLVAVHLASAGLALKDALATPDIVWDTAGIPKRSGLAKIALVPIVGATQYQREVKPKLTVAGEALEHQGG